MTATHILQSFPPFAVLLGEIQDILSCMGTHGRVPVESDKQTSSEEEQVIGGGGGTK